MSDMIKIQLMQNLMVDLGHYNWTYVHKDISRVEDTFRHDFPKAYEKIINGETNITRQDMLKN